PPSAGLDGGRLDVDADRRRIPAAHGCGGGAGGKHELDQGTANGHASLRVHGESYQATAELEKCWSWPVTVWASRSFVDGTYWMICSMSLTWATLSCVALARLQFE